jgi:hypothetical protein
MYYLHGAPHSAYTAKARSYLIKQAIPVEERAFGHRRFMQDVIPATQRLYRGPVRTVHGPQYARRSTTVTAGSSELTTRKYGAGHKLCRLIESCA